MPDKPLFGPGQQRIMTGVILKPPDNYSYAASLRLRESCPYLDGIIGASLPLAKALKFRH